MVMVLAEDFCGDDAHVESYIDLHMGLKSAEWGVDDYRSLYSTVYRSQV